MCTTKGTVHMDIPPTLASSNDYGIGISILPAGPGVSLNGLMDAAYTTNLPAIDAGAKSQALRYTGLYSNTENPNSSASADA